ncbi:MAG: DNA methyltransferase [Thermoanaerobacterales bacterium]|nr:DNA methyltransferase [Thermoanaerobacterales bacterium]
MHTKTVNTEELIALDLRPIIDYRVQHLKDSISTRGYDPACPLIVQPNHQGYFVVNGNHRLRALRELNITEVPVIEYPADEDLVRIALTTQENSESVQSWDFLDKAFLVKKLYDELGTQEKVAEKIGWERTTVSRYLTISSLPEECVTVIRKSVTVNKKNTGTPECDHGHTHNLDNIWSVRWFRHICSLPTDELKLMVIEKIADNPSSWKEKEVASECSRLKKRYELAFKVKSILGEQDNCKEDLTELLEAIDKGLYDSQPEKATERAEAILKARRRTDVELLADFGYEPQVYTIWNFTNRDERFGIKHPGNLPAGILFNILYYYSQQGDIVVDPMAGGGVTIDVCQHMKRTCIAFDDAPVRKDITKHNAVKKWPLENNSVSLVFIDPPYWKQKKGEYQGKNDIAKLELDDFNKAMTAVFQNAYAVLKPGGVLAVIVGPTQSNGKVYDHALDFAVLLKQAGFIFNNRIIVPYTTQQVSGFDVSQAKKSKYMLKLHRDLLVYSKGVG